MRGINVWAPWLLGFVAAMGFGYIARRTAGSVTGWAIGGGLCSFLFTAAFLGLANAVTVPYSTDQYNALQTWATAAAAIVIVVTLVLTYFLRPYKASNGLIS